MRQPLLPPDHGVAKSHENDNRPATDTALNKSGEIS
jgi:hypothetical protein